MDAMTIAGRYYDAWIHRAGDMTGVPLAPAFSFTGPVADFDDADGYRAMAREAGAAVRGFRVRHQFATGDLVCSIVDWEMEPLPGTLTAAELLHIRDGQIVKGELIYDAEDLRRAMAGATDPLALLRGCYDTTAGLIERIAADGWSAASACRGWTVRQAANHLTGALLLITRVAEGETLDLSPADARREAETDHLGSDPAAAFREVTERSMAALGKPGALGREFPFLGGPASGAVLVSAAMQESLVHGWDIDQGARAGYEPAGELVDAVWAYARHGVGDDQRKAGLFAEAVPVSPTATRFVTLLGHLGRRA